MSHFPLQFEQITCLPFVKGVDAHFFLVIVGIFIILLVWGRLQELRAILCNRSLVYEHTMGFHHFQPRMAWEHVINGGWLALCGSKFGELAHQATLMSYLVSEKV